MLNNHMDITGYPELDIDALKERITKDVEKTQSRSVILPLPDLLMCRPDQYELMQTDPDLSEVYDSEDYIWRTPLNVMELRIQK